MVSNGEKGQLCRQFKLRRRSLNLATNPMKKNRCSLPYEIVVVADIFFTYPFIFASKPLRMPMKLSSSPRVGEVILFSEYSDFPNMIPSFINFGLYNKINGFDDLMLSLMALNHHIGGKD
ncbi:hypothetical protein GQX74_012779 [Glossina fuscipes]|nr:hypothetical protein GQX74_012779 [Glossina fuscipes]